jgi:thioredoxin 2
MDPNANVAPCSRCGKKNRLRPRADGVPRCANCHQLLPWLVAADASTFEAEIAASVPVVVDFWADWCGPCKMISPVLEQAARNHAGALKIVKVDVDAPGNAPLSERFQIRGIPLLVLFENGREADRLVGAAPRRQIEQWLAPHLPTTVASSG